ncbi:MAG: NAD-glutamate dehydrogenase [Egibacteraceae bacterium]
MSDMSDMSDLLRPLLDRLEAATPERTRELAIRLATSAFRRMPEAEFERLDLDRLADTLSEGAAFVSDRASGELALRVLPRGEDDESRAGSVVECNDRDRPFLLSTLTEELERLELHVEQTIHPIFGVERDADGTIVALHDARSAEQRETWMHLELAERLEDDRAGEVTDCLRRVLADAERVTADFVAMRERISEIITELRERATASYDPEEVEEAAALLSWLLDDHFVLLGYRDYDLVDVDEGPAVVARSGSGLGILRDASSSTLAQPVPLAELSEEVRARAQGGELVLLSRTNARSTVHRRERMVYVGVKRIDESGAVVGEHRLLGLFAQKAHAEAASSIPLLRAKLRRILEAEDLVDHSHDERIVRTLFDALPMHELFGASTEELRHALLTLLASGKQTRVTLLCRYDPQARSASVLVALPRERFDAQVRQQVQRLLMERFEADSVEYHLSISEREQALMHFVLHVNHGEVARPHLRELRTEVTELTRTWQDELTDALLDTHPPDEARRLTQAWAARLPPSYRESTAASEAVGDIAELDRLSDETPVRMRVCRRDDGKPGLLRFKLYKLGPGVELSAFLPILESLGLIGVEELPHTLSSAGTEHDIAHVHDFGVRPNIRALEPLDLDRDSDRLADAALAIWSGRAEPDSLNELVLGARLSWQDVGVLRAYRRYRRQVGTAFTEAYQNEALCSHPGIARGLAGLFDARFNPERAADDDEVAAVRDELLAQLDEIERLDTDRILRAYLALIDATLRTNHYRQPRREWLTLKFDSTAIPDLPRPVPFAELFVYSTEMEGVHLRGGPVARGGIRWSERLEDFRTEVLGLMKAQVVKNAVIVPTGAKGGFVLKRPPPQGEALKQEVANQYERYVRALLDVTDNVIDGEVVPPDGVRRADDDDPYLVVAADRGTATFSDRANAISEEYGYWLQDAFASGGSSGYDHKAMGITARGAWVAVQRHFRELGVDVQQEPFTVVGVGDMSGDVFGNGMLRSRSIRLIAAFDHRHIFIDPDPDPERSFAERQRLFELNGSSWDDYDREQLSAGGGVWSRTTKRITLPEEARRVLRVSSESLRPPELVRAILAAQVDLLFFGGIGTFVKASAEANADAGDRANDAVRVDAGEVRARVIGEGGNLAVTQRGRIQYARRGGRINLDAIDNSAGVDTSDREVNLKILLQEAVSAGQLDEAQRDDELDAVSETVADQVLRDVYLQTWALSQECAFSPGGMEAYEQFMVDLEQDDRLDRTVEALPTTEEMQRRMEAGAGLSRPELAVLLSYAKIDLRRRMLASALTEQSCLREELETYFPERITERYDELLDRHRLRGELTVAMLANALVNRMGINYVSRTAHELGAMAADVAAGWWVATHVADAQPLWGAVEELDSAVEASTQLEAKREIDRLIDTLARAYVRQRSGDDLAELVARDRPAFQQVEKAVSARELTGPQSARAERYAQAGLSKELAERLIGLEQLALVPDMAELARRHGHDVADVTDVFFAIAEALPLDRLTTRLLQIEPDGHWQRWQHRGLVDELRDLRRQGASAALSRFGGPNGHETVERFLEQRESARQRVRNLARMLESEEEPGLAAFAVVVRGIRAVLAE